MNKTLLTFASTFALIINLLLPAHGMASSAAEIVNTPYADEQKIVFDFYFDEPQKINSALYWLKALVDPLMAEPYNLSPDDINIKVVMHGTEVVTLAKHNYERYKNAVERMRYYADLGVEFRLCAMTAKDYDYLPSDLQEFVQLVPSSIAELAHWQNNGYVLITPKIQEKRFSIADIR